MDSIKQILEPYRRRYSQLPIKGSMNRDITLFYLPQSVCDDLDERFSTVEKDHLYHKYLLSKIVIAEIKASIDKEINTIGRQNIVNMDTKRLSFLVQENKFLIN